MERLTHEADVGVEDWEQILYLSLIHIFFATFF